jgi:ABC-type transport system involved in multi-copper enzyme maturation permease subunit
MLNLIPEPLFAGFLNSLTIRTDPWVYNWLTSIWIIGLGALLGLLVILLLWLVGLLGSSIKPLRSLTESPWGKIIAGAVAGLLLFLLCGPILSHQLQERLAAKDAGSQWAETFWLYMPMSVYCFLAGVAIVSLFSRKLMTELPLLLQEGPLFWVAVIFSSFAIYGVLGVVLVRDPDGMLDSMRRWPALGRATYTFTVEAGKDGSDPPEVQLPINLRMAELREMKFTSNESVRLAAFSLLDKGNPPSFDISGGEALTWKMSSDPSSPFANTEEISLLFARNLGDQPTELTISALTAPAIPEMLTVPIVVITIVSLFLGFVLMYSFAPKLTAIALATAKSEMNTPFYILLTVGGAFLLFVFLWLPYNTFGEDIKMLKFTSLDVVRLLALLQAVWSASASVADEVEGKTALTVLSKPVSRRDFILGKFFGIAWLVFVMFVVYGSVMLLSIAYKPVYDIREGGNAPDRPAVADPLGLIDVTRETGLTAEEVNWQVCAAETVSTVPALLLVYCEALVIAAVSVAISTRLALVANFTICFSLFVLGHLTPLLVQSNVAADRFEAVIFIGQLITTVIPVLDYFDTSAAIAQGKAVQLAYLGMTVIYTLLYSTIAMLLAFVLFEDRDLA